MSALNVSNLKDAKYCVSRLCVLVLLLFFASYVLRLGARVGIKFLGSSNAFVQAVFFDRPDLSGKSVGTGVTINFAELYPFVDEPEYDAPTEAAENTYAEVSAELGVAESGAASVVENTAAELAVDAVQVGNAAPPSAGTMQSFSDNAASENAPLAGIAAKNPPKKPSKLSAIFAKIGNKAGAAKAKVVNIRSKLETWLSENVVCRYFFLEKANFAEVCVGWNLSADLYNPVVKLNNGHFSLLQKKLDTAEISGSIKRFAAFLRKQNVPFVYVQAPYKIPPYDEVYAGVRDFSNQNCDSVLQSLRADNINVLDLRDSMNEENRVYADMYFVTDHHWKPETGLWAVQRLARWVNANTELYIDDSIYDAENYDCRVYRNALLGSYGKKLTVAKTPADDFSLIVPKKRYDLHFEAYDKTNQLACNDGDFLSMIDMAVVESKQLYFNSPYHGYGYGSCNNFVVNNSAPNGYKVLLIGDSYSNVIAPFLALGVRRLDRLDLRYFNGSIESLVRKNGPYDLCVVLYNPDQYSQTPGYVSHEELFDFR